MYLPALARDLYKSQKEIEGLEKQLQEAEKVVDQEQLKDQLRQAKAEGIQLQKIMEGRKEQSKKLLNKPKFPF
jgi:hypothetical protein